MIFATNIRDPLLGTDNPFPKVLEAVLLSERYSSPAALRKMANLKSRGCTIISDNGNFTRLSSLAQRFLRDGATLVSAAKTEWSQSGAISTTLVARRKDLFRRIADTCRTESRGLNWEDVIGTQVSCHPNSMIGLEDFTVTVLTMCGVLHPVWQTRPSEIVTYQRQTLRQYLKQTGGRFGNAKALTSIRKYVVLHAFDYASAAQGAALYDGRKVKGVAVSFGGPMASKQYIREIALRGQVMHFPELLPEPYVLTLALLMGCMDGLKNKRMPIHILGLGSPIVIILIGYLLRRSAVVSIDGTSTYKDADDGVLYGSEPAYLKMDMYKVAAYALVRQKPYQSASPYFKWFEKRFPSNWSGLRRRLAVTKDADVAELTATLKANAPLLEQYVPFFTPARAGSDDLIRSVRMARGGTNYWILRQICAAVRRKVAKKQDWRPWLLRELGRYETHASAKWAMAVGQIKMLIEKYNP